MFLQKRGTFSLILRFTAFSLALISTTLLLGNLLFSLPQDERATEALAAPSVTVILDAGHGGRDGGASAENGTLEKGLNLAVAKKLRSLFEATDISVVMTRETDIELADPASKHKKRDDLNARLALSESYPDAIFVSIHMNKFPVEKYHGLQVYYSPNHGESPTLAEAVRLRNIALLDPDNERRTTRADDNIYLLSHIKTPAILVECGFLSNGREAAMLETPLYQEKLSMMLYAAILDYIDGATVTKKDGTG